MLTKLQIAKFLIVFGFFLNITHYGIGLVNFYSSEEKTSVVFEETENSEKKEKESSEKEDFKEKDKISQYHDEKTSDLLDLVGTLHPDFYLKNSSVYLEEKTPPPEFS
ncbi:hypothetical protein [Aquimarina sp. 2304DJ70-9]|uniref:hypothetical protein n=1 Tax=Aquimarina penaris TaxID=3231044 RepID=UPI003462B6EC